MIKKISITFGSEPILNKIKKANPDRELILYDALSNRNELMLLDASGKDSVFNSPVQYDVLSHSGTDDWRGFVSFITAQIDSDQQKVFDARVNRLMSNPLPDGMRSIYSLHTYKNINERVLLTTWNSPSQFELWKKANQSLMPAAFNDNPSFYSHESDYKFAR
ncbi:monooxygenase [Lentilactobacillus kosonis]|uniref:Monooxygenase n=1 Tax=Lentilactobacillus kosonis TaxID=2810561 RepID=A0A401FNS4_9LACO|nr:monooxygenase [Lentilactobacillus kosonis]GAY74039.1 hypothetical protein NBRC111893_2185 [Lentilactobacillus kosonis]